MNEDVEILAGGGIETAFLKFGVIALRTYIHRPDDSSRCVYEVWELAEEDLERLLAVPDNEWKKNWGWFRVAKGSNMGRVNQEYMIKGSKIMAWDGNDRAHSDCLSGHGMNQSYKIHGRERKYSNLLQYILLELGASTESNVCAIATDLAKQNGMKLSELFQKYLGS